MKQLAQNLRTGKTVLQEVPIPALKKGFVLIKTHKSLVSSGTEKMLVEFSKASLFEKAWQNPEKISLVLQKIKSEGFLKTIQSVSNKLDQLLPLGYCNAGEVIQVGEGVLHFKKGDRVISNGPHAEVVCVPVNLVCKIPPNVPDEEAVFTVLAAVALQGIRLMEPALGETVTVIGLGLVGLLTAQLLKMNGCRVIGIEPDSDRVRIAADNGILVINPNETDAEKKVMELSGGAGADGVIITAHSKSDEIISQAARIARKRGKIVLTGSVGLNLQRTDFYQKELTFQVSCSYGPGRYDPGYEEDGIDYPLPFVRWTENRNFQSVLEMLSSGLLNVKPLISPAIPLQEFERIYSGNGISRNITNMIDYGQLQPALNVSMLKNTLFPGADIVSGVIGAGNFARMTMLPLLKKANMKYIASAGGLCAMELSEKYHIPIATSDYREMLADSEVNLVFIVTRHNLHAKMVVDAMLAKKHVFVEKPLALTEDELEEIIHVRNISETSLTVGFNRRFSPYAVKMKKLLGDALMNMVITVNAGYLPAKSWLNNPAIGGGRIIGEACHFIDLAGFLIGSPVVEVCMNAMPGTASAVTENASILLRYENGSTAVINYFSNGHWSYPKERVEVHSLGRTLILDDFRSLHGYGFKGFGRYRTGKEKGHTEQFAQLLESIKNGRTLIDFREIVNTTRATFAAQESLHNSCWVQVP